MARPAIRPFDEGHVPAAGRLLAERHRRHRLASPLLSPACEDPEVAAAAVAGAWSADGASGAVAVDGDQAVGFLLGSPKGVASWGENIWVEAAGCAATDAETARELYAAASTRWVDEGRVAHYVMLPAHDEVLVPAWFRLGFGHQHTHGIQTVPERPPEPPAGLTVRRAVRDDIPALARLDLVLPAHQGAAPTFASGPLPSYEEKVAGWVADVDDPDFIHVVAVRDGEVVATASGCAVEKSATHRGPARPDDALLLGFAAVLPAARGVGAGRAVAEAVAWAAAERGFAVVVTDWREPNLLSSRAWRGLGYRDTFVRLHRMIGH